MYCGSGFVFHTILMVGGRNSHVRKVYGLFHRGFDLRVKIIVLRKER